RRRSSLPESVAALVERLGPDSLTLTLVNIDQVEARTVVVQAGAYGEHQFLSATSEGRTAAIDAPLLTVHLGPGSGGRIEFAMKRYANQPTLAQPWNRGLLPTQ
ncbi:MAG TPA: hypothetical protein VFL57_01745, partial [Bryobacteraceae bacterium]|nr:hypothetical protein [Bryobacteraceae bacterium]